MTRSEFAERIAGLELSHLERAIALLWYYRQTQQFEERSASELANDLHDEDFPKPNVTRLAADLRRSEFTIRGRRRGTFQIDVRRLSALDKSYRGLLNIKDVKVSGAVLPNDLLGGTRIYLEKLAHQINGSYEASFFDASAVLCRRLMESLIIEVYMTQGRHHEIQQNSMFVSLDKLIAHIEADPAIPLGRNTAKTMKEVKQLGDTAAHDRTYITQQIDLDDIKPRYRKLITELLTLSGIRP